MTEAEAIMHREKYREALDLLKEIDELAYNELVTEQNNLISQIERFINSELSYGLL